MQWFHLPSLFLSLTGKLEGRLGCKSPWPKILEKKKKLNLSVHTLRRAHCNVLRFCSCKCSVSDWWINRDCDMLTTQGCIILPDSCVLCTPPDCQMNIRSNTPPDCQMNISSNTPPDCQMNISSNTPPEFSQATDLCVTYKYNSPSSIHLPFHKMTGLCVRQSLNTTTFTRNTCVV